MSKIRHENIVSLIAVSEDPVSIMMEYWVFSFTPEVQFFESAFTVSKY